MQNNDDVQRNPQEALEALQRVLSGESEEEFLRDSKIIGGVLADEYAKREQHTVAKALNPKGLAAAQRFEEFVAKHFDKVQHFEKFCDEFEEDITFDVILPRVHLANLLEPGIMHEFAAILHEASAIDISTEKEHEDLDGMIYLDISFPSTIRV